MAERLEHTYSTDGPVAVGDIREALSDVSDDDVSESSPITAGVPEAGVVPDSKTSVTLVVSGHDGTWTKTSETALRRAVKSVDGVGELASSEGGYDPDE
jgi:hypothetical protein